MPQNLSCAPDESQPGGPARRVRGLERESEPQIYFASAQAPDDSALFYAPKDLVVRTGGRIDGLAQAIRAAVSRADLVEDEADDPGVGEVR